MKRVCWVSLASCSPRHLHPHILPSGLFLRSYHKQGTGFSRLNRKQDQDETPSYYRPVAFSPQNLAVIEWDESAAFVVEVIESVSEHCSLVVEVVETSGAEC